MPHLVGRDREAGELRAAVTQALAGHGALVLLAGEAGAGKTTLVRHVLASEPIVVHEGLGVQGGGGAFGPVTDVFRSYVRSPVGGQPIQLPELSSAAGSVAGDAATVQEAIRLGLARIAGQAPLAVFLDDLHWADDATLDLLPVLARSIGDLPLLIVGAFRSDELPRHHRIRRVRAELRRAGQLHQIAVEPLDLDATTLLVEATAGPIPAAISRAIFDRTGGIPFFATELAAVLASSGRIGAGPSIREGAEDAPEIPLPESVREAVLLRAAGLSPNAREAMMAAAVAGQTFDPELVTAVAGLGEWPDEPERLGLVHESAPGRMSFRHGLIREAFYSEIPWTRRTSLHRGVAEGLTAAREQPALIAEHWARGRRPDRARLANLAAAEEFCAVHAYRDAARCLAQALVQGASVHPALGKEGEEGEEGEESEEGAAEIERLAVLERLAGCYDLAGEHGDAITAWREVADGRRALGDHARLGLALRRLAAALELRGRWPEALTSRDHAATAFTSAGELAQAASERLAAAAHLRSAGRFQAAVALLEIAGDQARSADRIDLVLRIRGHEGNARARMGEGGAGVEMTRSALSSALSQGLAGPAADIYQRLADALEHAGDYAGAKDTYDEAYTFCSANGLEPTAQLCRACLTAVLRQSGDWDRAVMLCRQVLRSPDSTMHARTVAIGMHGSILGLRGQTKRARPMLLEACAVARQIELAAMELVGEWSLAVIDSIEGAPDSAAARCWSVLERWRETEDRHYAISPLRWATTFFAETGDVGGARSCAAALAQIASGTDQDEIMSALSHALGETALLDGNPEAAAAAFTQALALLHSVEAPIERAESGRRAGAALAALGRREEAVEQLVAAHRTVRRLEARPFAERLAGDLERLGERADRRLGRRAAEAAVNGGLTRRETEVLRLVAAGQTNREIAGELFLSPRTVETHVSNIVLKLDCRSRADAARRASELGLLSSEKGSSGPPPTARARSSGSHPRRTPR